MRIGFEKKPESNLYCNSNERSKWTMQLEAAREIYENLKFKNYKMPDFDTILTGF